MRVALLAAALLASAPAIAEPIPKKARELAAHGREMHKRGDYERAIAAFKEAYVLAPSAGLLFNLAQAYRLMGNCDDASLMYRRYLATNPAPDARAIAETHLETVERCMHQRALDIPLDDSMAYLDVPPPPGPEKLIVDDQREIAEQREGATPRHLKTTIGIGMTIGGATALGVAGYYAVRSWQIAREVESAYDHGEKWPAIRDVRARGERADRDAKIFGIAGGLAVVGGVTLWVLGRRDERANRLAITPSAKGAQLSYAWTF